MSKKKEKKEAYPGSDYLVIHEDVNGAVIPLVFHAESEAAAWRFAGKTKMPQHLIQLGDIPDWETIRFLSPADRFAGMELPDNG
jgi:hypothetical protein